MEPETHWSAKNLELIMRPLQALPNNGQSRGSCNLLFPEVWKLIKNLLSSIAGGVISKDEAYRYSRPFNPGFSANYVRCAYDMFFPICLHGFPLFSVSQLTGGYIGAMRNYDLNLE